MVAWALGLAFCSARPAPLIPRGRKPLPKQHATRRRECADATGYVLMWGWSRKGSAVRSWPLSLVVRSRAGCFCFRCTPGPLGWCLCKTEVAFFEVAGAVPHTTTSSVAAGSWFLALAVLTSTTRQVARLLHAAQRHALLDGFLYAVTAALRLARVGEAWLGYPQIRSNGCE